MTVKDERIALSRPALAGAAVALLLMGALAAAYGPLLSHLMRRFDVGLSVAALVFAAHFAGALLGVVVAMRAAARLTARILVGGSLGLLGVGSAGVAVAPSWRFLLAAVTVIGLGFGALDLSINQLLAYSVHPTKVALLNGLNGVYGVGAVAAPLLVSGAGSRYPVFYAGSAAIAAAALFGLQGISGSLKTPPSGDGPREARRSTLVTTFAIAFALYVGTEVGIAGWMPTHLQSVGFASTTAATLTSGFWLALALGRFLVAPLSLRLPGPAIVLAGTAVAAAALVGALVPMAAPIAYLATGLAIAPIFPTGIAWVAALNPGNPRATSWLFPASMVGGTLIPTAIGGVIARVGAGWVPAILAAVAFSSLAAFAAASRGGVIKPRADRSSGRPPDPLHY